MRPKCPATGSWAVCGVVERLERAGLVPRIDTLAEVDEKPLTMRGAMVHLGKGDLELYVYPDARARANEQRQLAPDKYVAFDQSTMRGQPTLIVNANLIAILISRNDHLRERVADAITAGPPQAPSSTP